MVVVEEVQLMDQDLVIHAMTLQIEEVVLRVDEVGEVIQQEAQEFQWEFFQIQFSD